MEKKRRKEEIEEIEEQGSLDQMDTKEPASQEESKKETKEKVAELSLGEKLAEINEKYLRLYSEFDNYRRRTAKEKIDLIKYASEDIIKSLLPIIDDFSRAIQMVDENTQMIDAEGVRLINQKLLSCLDRKGLQPMESIGKKFDENFHEAVTRFPASSEEEKGMVMDEIEKGYLLNEKVIRYAKVVVAV